MFNVSFPGLGIKEFTLNPVAFTIPIFGGIEVRWYGIVITLGIIAAFSYCTYRAKHEKILFDDLLDMAIFTVIFGIIGARLYYVLTSLDKYDSFYDAIAIWEGGLAIYGGLIAGGLTIFTVCKIKKINFLKVADAVAPGVMIAQAIGRWGNFFNGEAHGVKVEEGSPLYFIRMGLSSAYNIPGYDRMPEVHPTFLYESLWNVVGFIIINLLYKKKKFNGQVFLMYVTWYGFGRMLIEGLRTDSLSLGVFRISQVVGFLCFVIGTLLLIINLVKARRTRLTDMDYAPAYPKFTTTATTAKIIDESGNTEMEINVSSDSDPMAENAGNEDSQTMKDEPVIPQYTDVSQKLNKLFDISADTQNDNQKDQGENNG